MTKLPMQVLLVGLAYIGFALPPKREWPSLQSKWKKEMVRDDRSLEGEEMALVQCGFACHGNHSQSYLTYGDTNKEVMEDKSAKRNVNEEKELGIPKKRGSFQRENNMNIPAEILPEEQRERDVREEMAFVQCGFACHGNHSESYLTFRDMESADAER